MFFVLIVKNESGHFSGQFDMNFTVYIIIIRTSSIPTAEYMAKIWSISYLKSVVAVAAVRSNTPIPHRPRIARIAAN